MSLWHRTAGCGAISSDSIKAPARPDSAPAWHPAEPGVQEIRINAAAGSATLLCSGTGCATKERTKAPPDQLVEQPRGDVFIPFRAVPRWHHFRQVESHDPPPAAHHRGEQSGGHLEGQPAGHLGAGMRAEGRVQPIDVEADVDVLRQRLEDAQRLLAPGRAREAGLGQLGIEEGPDAAARGGDALVLLLAEVANTDLHEAR